MSDQFQESPKKQPLAQLTSIFTQQTLQFLLTLVLVVASFFIGMLWTKVQYLEGKFSGSPTANNNAAGGAGAVVDANAKSYSEIAKEVGLNVSEFKKCLDSGEMASKVSADAASGAKAGVQGTPGNILLDTQTGRTAVIPGALPYEMLKPALDEFIAGKTPKLKSGTQEQELASTTGLDPVSKDDYVRGSRSARYALIEYSDLECPFCKRFHPTAQRIQSEYSNLMWVYRHFPLESLHPNAQKMAQASECAGKLGGNDAFWSYVDKLELTSSIKPE